MTDKGQSLYVPTEANDRLNDRRGHIPKSAFVKVLLNLWDLAPDNLKAQAILGQRKEAR